MTGPQSTSDSRTTGAAASFEQGFAFLQSGQLAEARKIYEDILGVQPEHADALNLLGVIVFQLGDARRAVDLIGKAIQIHPNNADYHCNHGIVQAALGQMDAAQVSYDKAIAIRPRFAEAYNNLGLAQAALGQLDAAIASYDKALEFKHEFADAYSNKGIVLAARGQLEAAVVSYATAISIRPNYAEAHSNLGNVQAKLGKLEAAIASYDRAIAINPNHADSYYNRGNALKLLKQLDAAVVSYEKALDLNPSLSFLGGTLLHTKKEICDWKGMDARVGALISQIQNNQKASPPLDIQGLCDSPSLHKLTAETWMRTQHPPNYALGPIPKKSKDDKIRIGYYSADFRDHAVSQLAVEIFEHHERTKFELVAFSFRPEVQDSMRARVESAFSKFVEVKKQSDREIAQLSRELEIDIAVDLGGLTGGNRPGVFAYRAAPIQVNYLGYSGTMAAEYYDYLIADLTLVPQASQIYYSEKIAYIPSRQAAPLHRAVTDKKFTREEVGLPSLGFVFCCFNNHIKISPSTFDGWMRVLKGVEGSVLFLNIGNDLAKTNIKNEAALRGVDPERIIFKGYVSAAEYLALYDTADLFLDTFPYTAATTASDACWAGLPVLMLMGESYASRMAGSVLSALGLPELIVRTQQEYETLAIELATNPVKLSKIRAKLKNNRLVSPVFDSKLVTRHIEAAYTEMYERYHRGLPPDHIDTVTR